MEDLEESKESEEPEEPEEPEEKKELSDEFEDISIIKVKNIEYNVQYELGEGQFGYVYLVKEFNSNIKYAIKIFKQLNDNSYENEVNMYNKLSNKDNNNSYIIKMYKYGICKIYKKKDHPFKKTNFILLEYASKGSLFDYISENNEIIFTIGNNNRGLRENYGKLLFSKILKGIIECHNAGISHRDIKLENILLDETFNPKIGDLGCATLTNKIFVFNDEYSHKYGTIGYLAPELYKKEPYDRIRADIFSLGILLIMIVTGYSVFQTKKKLGFSDPNYYSLIKKNLWLKNYGEISDNFKNLAIRMISVNPKKRPYTDKIMEDVWMKDINYKLEKDLYNEFIRRGNILKEFYSKKNVVNIYNSPDDIDINDNKSSSENIYNYFKSNFELQYIDENNLDLKNYMKINGCLNPKEFMNLIATKIKEQYNKCEIFPSNNYYKFVFVLNYEEEEISEEEQQKLKELGVNDIEWYKNLIKKENLKIRIILYESNNSSNTCYIIRFIKISGEINDYYNNLNNIISIIKKNI